MRWLDRYSLGLLVVTSMVMVACGGQGSELSPTAPTGVAGSAAGSAAIGVAMPPAADVPRPFLGTGQGLRVSANNLEVEGRATVASLVSGTGCPTLAFTVQGYGGAIRTTAATVFVGGTCANIAPGRLLQIKGNLETDGSVTATLVNFEDGANEIEGTGTVQSLVAGAACPTLEFFVQGIRVRTDASTVYLDMDCSGITVGRLLQIKGIRQADGSVLATRIKPEDNPGPGVPGDPTAPGAEVEGTGTVQGAPTGACPTLTFTVQGIVVRTHAATVYLEMTCAGITAGRLLQIKGIRQTDGSVLATRIKPEDNPGPGIPGDPTAPGTEVEGTGTVQGAVTGACPAVSFSVAGLTVRTNMATVYLEMDCSGITTGRLLQIKGIRQADGSVLATRIKPEDTPTPGFPTDPTAPGAEYERNAVVDSLVGGTSCPDLEFMHAGVRVRAHGGTEYRDIVCTQVTAGRVVDVNGTRQADGSVLARRIKIQN